MGLQSRSSSDAVLIVEGQDDRHVVGHLWHRQTGEEPPFDILDAGNDRKALSMFGLALRDPRRRAVGILVDADDNAPGRWEAVRRRLSDEDITAPIESNRDGIIIEANEDVPRVGVWLMPDNSSAGELEDFVVKMARSLTRYGRVLKPISTAFIQMPGSSARARY